jgi:hypothetical protein
MKMPAKQNTKKIGTLKSGDPYVSEKAEFPRARPRQKGTDYQVFNTFQAIGEWSSEYLNDSLCPWP